LRNKKIKISLLQQKKKNVTQPSTYYLCGVLQAEEAGQERVAGMLHQLLTK